MDCHANALAAACAFACHKTSWLVRHGPRPLVLGFPTSPSTSATSSSTFSAHAPPGGSNDSRLPRPGLAQGGEAATPGMSRASLPCSLARIPSSFLHLFLPLSTSPSQKFGCRRQSRHPAPAAPACRRGGVAACRQHGLDAYFDGETQRRCSAHPGSRHRA
jgi:hypothetical protein